MSFTLEAFVKIRPFLYHLTYSQNVPAIRKDHRLHSAAAILTAGGMSNALRAKRAESLRVSVDGRVLHVRDQKPLHERHIEFAPGWTFEHVLRELNKRVFFWAGTLAGPCESGINHAERYNHECPAVLRLNTQQLFSLNAPRVPQFCRYNSGSPRSNQGNRIPRGPDTFQQQSDFSGTSCDVIEVTYVDYATLPEFQLGRIVDGRWVAVA